VTGLGEAQLSLKNTATTTVIVGIAMIFGLGWGLVGVCVGALIGFVLAVTINLRRNLALLDAGYRCIMSVCLPSLLAAAVMCAAVFGADATLLSGLSPAMRLPPAVALGALVYSAITLALNRGTAIRSLQVVRGSI
jgi:hypothetical protein